MATRGRKPKSVRVKVRDGNPGKRQLRVVGGSDSGDGGGPPRRDRRLEPPSYLDGVGKAEWRRLMPLMLERGQYIEAFRQELAKYCVAFSMWRTALAEIEKAGRKEGRKALGLVQTTPSGYLVQSAWFTIANKAHEQMGRIAADFGLNPVGQMRLEGAQLDLFDRPGQQGAAAGGNRFDQF